MSSAPERDHIRRLAAFFAIAYFIQSLGDPGSGIVAQPIRSMLHDWGEGPADIALFMALVGLPWAAKPVFGMISDFFPFRGSRRRSYLIASCLASAVGFAFVALTPLSRGDGLLLFALVLMPAIGVAFSDVLIDAVMIDEGQPRGLTGVLQSVQWSAAYAGLIVTGVAGGYFSDTGRVDLAFGLCAALWFACLLLAFSSVSDPPVIQARSLSPGTLAGMLARPGLLAVGAMLFVWNFNPLWTTVLYLHMTQTLAVSERAFGETLSVFYLGGLLASLAYPLYCRRLPLSALIHLSILAGIGSNLVYLALDNLSLAYIVSIFGGFAYMTGTMVQMDIVARRVPLVAAATVFAVMMGLSNLASSLSEALGGEVYERLQQAAGPVDAYQAVVVLSVVAPALCWLLIPVIRRQLPDWFDPRTTP